MVHTLLGGRVLKVWTGPRGAPAAPLLFGSRRIASVTECSVMREYC